MQYPTEQGILNIEVMESSGLGVRLGLEGSIAKFELWVSRSASGFGGRVDVSLGKFGTFGYEIDPITRAAGDTYRFVDNMPLLVSTKLYKAISELAENVRNRRIYYVESAIELVAACVIEKGPFFIDNHSDWRPNSLQRCLLESVDLLRLKQEDPSFKKVADIFVFVRPISSKELFATETPCPSEIPIPLISLRSQPSLNEFFR